MQASAGSTDTGLLPRLAARERTLWVIVAVGLCADTALTYHGLQTGMYELNPIIRASIGVLGVLSGILVVKLIAVLTGLCLRFQVRNRGSLGALVPAVLAVPWLLGAAINAVGLAGL